MNNNPIKGQRWSIRKPEPIMAQWIPSGKYFIKCSNCKYEIFNSYRIATPRKCPRCDKIEELADVGVMLEQLYQSLSLEEKATFIKTQNNKILRQIERIKGESYKPDDLHEQLFRQGYIEGLKKAKEKGNAL